MKTFPGKKKKSSRKKKKKGTVLNKAQISRRARGGKKPEKKKRGWSIQPRGTRSSLQPKTEKQKLIREGQRTTAYFGVTRGRQSAKKEPET